MQDTLEHNAHDLLLAVADGDQKAFRRFVDRYWNRVYSAGPRNYPGRVPPYLEQTGEPPRSTRFSKFLFVLSRNSIVSVLRKKMYDLPAKEPWDGVEDVLLPDQQREYKEVHTLVRESTKALPPTCQKVFEPRLERKTYAEIAGELGVSRNTDKEHIILFKLYPDGR